MFKKLSIKDLPTALNSTFILDDQLVPRFWATVWSIMALHSVAPSTRDKYIRYVESLYQHSDQRFGQGSLDDAIGSREDGLLGQILESWFISITNQPIQRQSDDARWQKGVEFVKFIVTWKGKDQATDRRMGALETSVFRLAHLYRQLRVQRSRQANPIRSLPPSIIEWLFQCLDPLATANPFKSDRTKWMAYVCFVLMLHQGLRRGEILLLPVDSIKDSFDATQNRDRHWINVQSNPYVDHDEDLRFSRPSIKNAQSIRQIPVSGTVATIVQRYVENYRGRPSHPFLLNSQKNLPLSTEAITKIFARVSKALPDHLRRELLNVTGQSTVTPHNLRHTSAVMRLNQMLSRGDSMDEATQKLRSYFGWSRTSNMPLRYARAVFEDRLTAVWADRFDSQVSILRSIS